jgi:hypothetical protein
MPKITGPTPYRGKPIKYSSYKDTQGKTLIKMKKGVLCYAVLRRYKGKGAPRIILHEVTLFEATHGFGYGGKEHYVFKPKGK